MTHGIRESVEPESEVRSIMKAVKILLGLITTSIVFGAMGCVNTEREVHRDVVVEHTHTVKPPPTEIIVTPPN